MERFNHNAKDNTEAASYLFNRSTQLLQDGYELRLLRPYGEGVMLAVYAGPDNKQYRSIYVLEGYRGKGVYMDAVNKGTLPVVTVPDCQIEDFLKAKSIPHIVAGEFHSNPCYEWIQKTYRNTRAKRSGHFYMDHIDEGLAILNEIEANPVAKEGFCLHPLAQLDAYFTTFNMCARELNISINAAIAATEYRNVANAYLSPMGRRKAKDIKLSPLKDVNDMLIADKVQNRKAFEMHREKYTNATELDYYFKAWLERLGISEERYLELADLITVCCGIPTEIRSKRWAKNHAKQPTVEVSAEMLGENDPNG